MHHSILGESDGDALAVLLARSDIPGPETLAEMSAKSQGRIPGDETMAMALDGVPHGPSSSVRERHWSPHAEILVRHPAIPAYLFPIAHVLPSDLEGPSGGSIGMEGTGETKNLTCPAGAELTGWTNLGHSARC